MNDLSVPLTEAQHDCLMECYAAARSRGNRLCRKPTLRSHETMHRLVQAGYLVKLMRPEGNWAVTRKADAYVGQQLKGRANQ